MPPSDTFTQQPPSSSDETPSDEISSAPDDSTTEAEEPSAEASETTTAPREDESTSQEISPPENTEYDILRTGEFSFVGVITGDGESTDINISLGKDKVYVTSEVDGLEIGMYFEGNKTFIYAPKHKKYLRMSTTVAKVLGMDPSDFMDMAEGLGFDKLPPLSSATSMENGTVNGAACEIYTFSSSEAGMRVRVYMSGKKLLKIEYVDNNSKLDTAISMKSVSAGFPKMPPDGFEEIGYLEFFRLIAGDM